MALQRRERFKRPVGGSDRRLTVLGWGIVVAAAVVAVAVVVLVDRSTGHAAGQPSVARRPAGGESTYRSYSSFRYCGHRSAVFTGKRAFVGITDPSVETSSRRNCALGVLAANHLGYFRGTLAWAGVEPIAGRYNFAFYDSLVAQLARHHMRFMPGLLLTPRWASSAPSGAKDFAAYPPTRPAEFGDFAAVCVRRYGPGGTFWRAHPGLPYYPVTAWQVWNEPDLSTYWRPRPDAAAYVRMLHAVYGAIKRVDPHATVVAAGMPFYSVGNERSFLSALFRAGMAGSFDALSIHAYSPIQAPGRLELARALMNRYGARHAQLWSTELAWASGPPDPWVANPGSQAAAIRSFFGPWLARNRARLGLDQIFWYSLQDRVNGPDPAWWGWNLGLLTTKNRPKPGLAALSAAAQRLDQ